jgi:hypothetical protein
MSNNFFPLESLLRLLLEVKKTNITQLDPEDIDSRDEDKDFAKELSMNEKHPDYLWLLIFDLLIFLGLAFTSYNLLQKLNFKKTEKNMNSIEEFKHKFLTGLLYANGSNLN